MLRPEITQFQFHFLDEKREYDFHPDSKQKK